MAKEIAFENGRISNFKGLVTLTLDRAILHTAVNHSSTPTFVPNFIEIKEAFCGRTDVPTYVRTFETGFIDLISYLEASCACLSTLIWSYTF